MWTRLKDVLYNSNNSKAFLQCAYYTNCTVPFGLLVVVPYFLHDWADTCHQRNIRFFSDLYLLQGPPMLLCEETSVAMLVQFQNSTATSFHNNEFSINRSLCNHQKSFPFNSMEWFHGTSIQKKFQRVLIPLKVVENTVGFKRLRSALLFTTEWFDLQSCLPRIT